MNTHKILIVDDEEEIRDLFKEVLESRGYEVMVCESGNEAVDAVKAKPVFAVFLDIRMPGLDGIEALKQIRQIQPETNVVMITGYTRSEAVNEALRLGCFVCMMKPFKLRDVLGVLDLLEAGADDYLPRAA